MTKDFSDLWELEFVLHGNCTFKESPFVKEVFTLPKYVVASSTPKMMGKNGAFSKMAKPSEILFNGKTEGAC